MGSLPRVDSGAARGMGTKSVDSHEGTAPSRSYRILNCKRAYDSGSWTGRSSR